MEKYSQNKKFSNWLKVVLSLTGGGALICALIFFFSANGLLVVERQLGSLKSNRISQAYYEYTSKNFQKTTSLDAFRKFIKLYPVLTNNRDFILEENTVIDGKRFIKGILVSNDLEEMRGEWNLVNEDSEWKVSGLQLVKNDRNGMVEYVKGQLGALRKNDVVEAYYSYVSKDFQKETPLAVFEEFVRENPILINYRDLQVDDTRIENDKGFVSLVLSGEVGNYLLEYKLNRTFDRWTVYSLRVVLPAEVAAKKAETNTEALVPPIRQILEKLIVEDYLGAYDETAKEFQESTPFDQFKQFISGYPALTERDLADIKKGIIQNGTGKLCVNLHNEDGMTVVEFRLGFEEGQWQIWGMEVLASPVDGKNTLTPLADQQRLPLADQLFNVLRGQMTYLRHQDILEAYEYVMAEDYRLSHSFETFEEFLKTNSVFVDHRTSYFNRILEQDGQATLRGTITTFNGETFPVRYDFSKEGREWKISDMAVLHDYEPIAEAEIVLDKQGKDFPPKPLEFVKVVLGTSINKEGIIKQPLQELIKGEFQLFFNVYLKNSIEKATISLYLEHVDSGSSAPPLTLELENDGETIALLSYGSPREGWPSGNYIAKLTASTGAEYIFNFEMIDSNVKKQ